MDHDDEDKTRTRAYEIWEREGRGGDPRDHWRQAEQELAREMQGAPPDSAGTVPEQWAAVIDSAVEKICSRAHRLRRQLRMT